MPKGHVISLSNGTKFASVCSCGITFAMRTQQRVTFKVHLKEAKARGWSKRGRRCPDCTESGMCKKLEFRNITALFTASIKKTERKLTRAARA